MSDDGSRIGLAETIEALHADLREAAARAVGQDIQFPVGAIEIQLQVGVTRSATAKTGVKAWVVDLGAEGSLSRQSLQLVKVTLQAPVDKHGQPVVVAQDLEHKP